MEILTISVVISVAVLHLGLSTRQMMSGVLDEFKKSQKQLMHTTNRTN